MSMKIYKLALDGAATVLSSGDIYTLANANLVVDKDPSVSGNEISAIVAVAATNQAIFSKANIIGGTDVPVEQVAPSYYPKAVMGAECGAHVSSLGWADTNLNTGYQYVKTARGYFVAGILNSTQTEANDPFDSALIVSGSGQGTKQVACWDEPYGVTYNPFA